MTQFRRPFRLVLLDQLLRGVVDLFNWKAKHTPDSICFLIEQFGPAHFEDQIIGQIGQFVHVLVVVILEVDRQLQKVQQLPVTLACEAASVTAPVTGYATVFF